MNKPNITSAIIFSFSLVLMVGSIAGAVAGPREQAKRIHDRLTGVPPTEAVLQQMADEITNNSAVSAAQIAMQNRNFYNVTLKNFVTPWTNEDQTVYDDLNDYTATVIGMIRDDMDFRQVLYGDVIYVGAGNLGLTAYSLTDNQHYEQLEDQNIDLSDETKLVKSVQSAVTGLAQEATAGVMTTRAAAKAFFYAGTNRAMFRFTMMNHLCEDLEQVKDVTRPTDRIRQDVTRSPGGDSRIFMNSCVGCHSGMDPLVQAFAYYEYEYDEEADPDAQNGRLVYTPGQVQAKYLINESNFKYGFVTPDDNWDNYWRQGLNQTLGWDSNLTGSGSGAKSLGMELAHSEAFARCQVEKVFKATCLREPTASDSTAVNNMVTSFKAATDGLPYNMKRVFAESAAHCSSDI